MKRTGSGKRSPILGVVLAFAIALAAAGAFPRAIEPGGAQRGGTFRMAITTLSHIDPALLTVAADGALRRAHCASLMNFPRKPLPAGARLEPELASNWPKISRDGRTYTFTIRKGVRFSTGAPVSAANIAHAINRSLNPALKAPLLAEQFRDIVGADAVLAGRAETASGVRASGRKLVIKLTKPVGDFLLRTTGACAEPTTLRADPEGAGAPLPSAGRYFIAEWIRGRRVVLERNRFFRGPDSGNVDRFVIDLDLSPATILERVEAGTLDYGWMPILAYADRQRELAQRYGVNRAGGRFFLQTDTSVRTFVLNLSRPLFRGNLKLRQAVNFAIDRKALRDEFGYRAGTLTEQFVAPTMPGFRNEHIYPLKRPDLTKARALARGRTRGGKAVLYVPNVRQALAQAPIVRDNLRAIGLDVEIMAFPFLVLVEKLRTPGEPFDIGWIGWLGRSLDPSLSCYFHGREIGTEGGCNLSYMNSPKYNRLLDRAERLGAGPARYRAFGQLDVDIMRNVAPVIVYSVDNRPTLVSSRVGCVVVNPEFDFAVACLK
jgi:peptide/nickel transport system substrate-binding protein